MSGEKSEAPTPRRREEARQRGQVARSHEISSVAVLFVGLMALNYTGGQLLAQYQSAAYESFRQIEVRDPRPDALLALAASMVSGAAMALIPLVASAMVVGVAVNLVQVGPLVSLHPVKPDFSRINPLQGFQRLFSARALVELAKAAVKLGVTGFIAFQVVRERYESVIALQAASPQGTLATMGSLMMEIGVKCGLGLLVMAAADYLYQRHTHESGLRMSREDLKEEMRHSEGDPLLKGKIRQMQRQMASRRMMAAVPHSDVVVTNPTHFAVALEYKPEHMHAPVVTAKGQLLVAEKIKELAKENRVPVVENAPLARALHRSVEIGAAVPPELYQAVAEVLAFIYSLRERGDNRQWQ